MRIGRGRRVTGSGRRQHQDTTVHVLDLVTYDDRAPIGAWLIGHTFTNCEIVGPAVLFPADDAVIFRACTHNPEDFWVVDPTRSYVGGVGVKGCLFERCTFRDVGIAMPAVRRSEVPSR